MSDIKQITSLNYDDLQKVNWNNLNTKMPSISRDDILQGNFNVGYIKNIKEMGITFPGSVDHASYTKSTKGYQQYMNALLTGDSSATTISNNGAPLGDRQFVKNLGIQCLDSQQNVRDRWSIVDGMAYLDGEPTKNGLIFSAYQTWQDATDLSNNAGKIITEPTTYNDNNCVAVNLIKNVNGDTEKGYISTNEYDIFKKKNPTIFAAGEGFENHHGHHSGTVNRFNSQFDNRHHYLYDNHNYRNVGQGFFYDSIINSNWLMSPVYVRPLENIHELEEKIEEEREKKLDIKDDIVTGFFLGSITVLSLFILYRLFDRNPLTIRDN